MTANDKVHQGRNIKRFREMLGYKQDGLAYLMGDDWSQRRISLLEAKEQVDRPTLELVSKALKIPVEAFENFEEENAINVIANTIHNHDQSAVIQYHPVFNSLEEIKKLHEEKMALYERMLKEKEEMVGRLERLLNERS